MLSLGTIIGQNDTSKENLEKNKKLYYLGEVSSSLSGFARGIVHSSNFRYRFDLEDIKADLAEQRFGYDLLQGNIDMNNFDITDYLN